MSRVEGKMSRVQKCRLHSGFESLVKKPEFLGRFYIIEQFTFLFEPSTFYPPLSTFFPRTLDIFYKNQEPITPITRSLHLSYILESTFARIFLFLETCFPQNIMLTFR